jgi:tetratricopeptide (TPR) repeat protein
MHLGRIYVRYGWINANQNKWQSAIADYEKAAVIFQEITRLETQNMTARRYLAGQYANIAEVHTNMIGKGNEENQRTHKSEALQNYQKALDIFLQLQA